MDCSVVEADLIAYQLATCDDEARAQIDAHLLGCTPCLRAYLALKHHVERGATLDARPSDAARARLRAAVAAEFQPTLATRAARALRRPIPLYQSLAAAAVIVLVAAAIAPILARNETQSPMQATGGQRIDTARRTPENLSFY
jgi:hypothetical protein